MICCRKKRSRSLSHLLMSSCTQEDTTNYKQLISQTCNFNVVHHRSKQSEPGESTSTRWHFAFGLCCHSNETCAPIANPPKEDNPYHSSKLHPGPYSSVGMWRGTDRQTDRQTQATVTDTQTRVTNIQFASSTTHAKCSQA